MHGSLVGSIEIANQHPRVKILKLSPSAGENCIAVDPWFLVEAVPERACLIRQTRLVNDAMPENFVQKVISMVKPIDRPKIACLGLTYKANFDDVRESPAPEIVEKLIGTGLTLSAFDPHVVKMPTLDGYVASSLDDALVGANLLLLLVDHSEFKALMPDKALLMRGREVLDTRG